MRIADLAQPELTADQSAVLQAAEQLESDVSVEAVLDAARRRTGLDDFGAPDHLERLEVLVRSVNEDSTLLAAGRFGVMADLTRYAANRLLIEDVIARHPEIEDEKVVAPSVVAGLPRSGTTHLLNLLAADHRFRSLPYWESCEPVAPRPAQRNASVAADEDPRHRRARREWETTEALLPLMAAMHPMTPDHIHEELELMGPDFASYNFEWRWHAPRWRDHYLTHDQRPHYLYMRRVLGLLQWQDRAAGQTERRRWVLKCPQHLEQLPVLLETFPDATVVITHRDPTSVVASAATMVAYGDRMRRSPVDPHRTAHYWADRIDAMLTTCVRDRPDVSGERVIDLPFLDLVADDLGAVRRIHETAGVEPDDGARAALESYATANTRGTHGSIDYDLEGVLGLDRSELRARFAGYMDAFGIRPEGQQ